MCRKFKISQTTFASIWNCDSSAKKTTTLPRHPGMCSECFGGQAGLMELGSFGSDILNFTSIFDTKNHRWISSVQKKVAFKSQRMRQNPETNRQKHLKIDPKGKGNSYWKTTIFRFEPLVLGSVANGGTPPVSSPSLVSFASFSSPCGKFRISSQLGEFCEIPANLYSILCTFNRM